jgi:hypothetical protein
MVNKINQNLKDDFFFLESSSDKEKRVMGKEFCTDQFEEFNEFNESKGALTSLFSREFLNGIKQWILSKLGSLFNGGSTNEMPKLELESEEVDDESDFSLESAHFEDSNHRVSESKGGAFLNFWSTNETFKPELELEEIDCEGDLFRE